MLDAKSLCLMKIVGTKIEYMKPCLLHIRPVHSAPGPIASGHHNKTPPSKCAPRT